MLGVDVCRRAAFGSAGRALPTPDDEPNAHARMLSNGYEFCRVHRRPPTAVELLAFYAAGPSANQDHETPRRTDQKAALL